MNESVTPSSSLPMIRVEMICIRHIKQMRSNQTDSGLNADCLDVCLLCSGGLCKVTEKVIER